MTNPPISCDVLVLGGGPAGSTISALLAEKGWHVEVLEKARHPRFHIGESLLPQTLPILKRLGVLEEVKKIGLKKYGAQVISTDYNKSLTFYFSRAMDKSQPYAFQVRRSEFDDILLRNSHSKGAIIHEDMRATGVEFRQDGSSIIQAIDIRGDSFSWETRYLVDATGRNAFLATLLGCKQRNLHHNTTALFSHFENVERLEGKDEGNISIAWFDYGWFWIIPFKDGITSVGAVCWPSYLRTRTTNLDQFLWKTISLCPSVAERFKKAKLVMPTTLTGNYSYQASHMTGSGYIIIGDAYAFVDPVFSSGVHLAMNSALLGAEVVNASLKNMPEFETIRFNFERTVGKGLNTFSWFIYRFTQPAFQYLFMFPRNIFRMEEAILSLLAGDVFSKNSPTVRLWFFKILYYFASILNFKSNRLAAKKRKQSVKEKFIAPNDLFS